MTRAGAIQTAKGPLIHVKRCDECPFLSELAVCLAPQYLYGGKPMRLEADEAGGTADPPRACELRKHELAVILGPYRLREE